MSLNAKNNIVQNKLKKSLNNLIFLKNTFNNISKIYISNKQYKTIKKIDYYFGKSLLETIKEYIKLNKILVKGIEQYIKKNSLNLINKEYNDGKLKSNNYKNLINEYINIINKSKNNLSNRANYLLFLESIKNISVFQI